MAKLIDREQQILELCLASLHALPDCRTEFTPAKDEYPEAGTLELLGPWGGCRYQVNILPRLTPLAAELAVHRHQNAPDEDPALLMTDYVSENSGQTLRAGGVQYVDTAGNASLRQGTLLVEVSGRKRAAKPPRTSRGFQPTGLRLIHLLLKKPEALNWTYRRLSREAGLALGAVGPVLKELQERGFAKPDQTGKLQLQNRLDLFQRWEIGYLERLRPKLLLETCTLAAGLELIALPELIRKQHLQGQVQIGGELGAALVMTGIQPRKAALHIKGDPLALMLRLRLVPDPEGQVTLLHPLGNRRSAEMSSERLSLADPLLLHAEIAGSGAGGEDISRMIYERYLARHLLQRNERETQEENE